jgi:hypothetical protein
MLRLTVDPDFGAALYQGDPTARRVDVHGGPYTLTDADLSLFQAVDSRAWTTDVYRRTRLVQALIEEYAVTTAIVGVPVVHRFFGTARFAEVLGHRGSTAEAFGEWAQSQCTADNREVVRLETAIAQARRDARPSGPGIVSAPGKEGVRIRTGTLEAWQQGLSALGGNPVQAAADGVRWSAPAAATGWEHWLLERSDTGSLGVHPLSAAQAGLMVFCRTPRPHSAVTRQARKLKVGKKDIRRLLRTMQDNGLLELRRS